jgi:ribosomal protein S18 acetylase RimI-like enzyme
LKQNYFIKKYKILYLFLLKVLKIKSYKTIFMQIVKKITAKDTYFVRNQVLRKGKPLTSCFFEGDNLQTTSHFGIYAVDKCIGILSVFQIKNNSFGALNQFQIRGMAVLPEFQELGIGKQLINHCENLFLDTTETVIWCNAREKAVGFYEKMGFDKIGNPFIIDDIGIHYIMYKSSNE